MKFKFHFYELHPKGKIGKVAPLPGQTRRGAIVQVTFPSLGKSVGYADCFPWPELGDLTLEQQIETLQTGRYSDLTQQSLKFAQVDAQARSQGISLFKDLQIPKSHFLVTDLALLTPRLIEEIASLGFQKIKVKLSSAQDAKPLAELSRILRQHSIQLRFDFNGSQSFEQIEEFLNLMGPLREQINFIEDPTPYDPIGWTTLQSKWGVRLALDRVSESTLKILQPGSFSVLVIKPAIQDWQKMMRIAQSFHTSVVVTSYVGHPLEQLSSAWVAAQILRDTPDRIEECGLLSHHAYQANAFSDLLKDPNGILIPPCGTGFGFDALLETLLPRSF